MGSRIGNLLAPPLLDKMVLFIIEGGEEHQWTRSGCWGGTGKVSGNA